MRNVRRERMATEGLPIYHCAVPRSRGMFCNCKMATEVGLSLQRSINPSAPSGIIKFRSNFELLIVTSEMWTNERYLVDSQRGITSSCRLIRLRLYAEKLAEHVILWAFFCCCQKYVYRTKSTACSSGNYASNILGSSGCKYWTSFSLLLIGGTLLPILISVFIQHSFSRHFFHETPGDLGRVSSDHLKSNERTDTFYYLCHTVQSHSHLTIQFNFLFWFFFLQKMGLSFIGLVFIGPSHISGF